VSDIFREADSYANVLGNIAYGGTFYLIYYEHGPAQVESYLLVDQSGNGTLNLINL
jgi:hypothetical protein